MWNGLGLRKSQENTPAHQAPVIAHPVRPQMQVQQPPLGVKQLDFRSVLLPLCFRFKIKVCQSDRPPKKLFVAP